MNTPFLKKYRELEPPPSSHLVAIARAAFAKGDVDFLCFGESDLSSPRAAIDSIKIAVEDAKNTRYPDIRGLPVLRNALAEYLTALHKKRVDEERIQVTASGMAAINVAFSAVVKPHDKVVIHGPAWPNVNNLAKLRGAHVEEVTLTQEAGRFSLDMNRLEEALCGASAFFLNSPNNPTGWTASDEDLREILRLCRLHGVWLVADDVYSRIYYGDRRAAPSVLDFANPEDKVIVCNSFSKTWAMTGWRLGWMVVPKGSRDVFTEIVELTHSAVTPFTQVAALAALQDTEFVDTFRSYCERGRSIVGSALQDIDAVEYASPQGAFYAFLKIRGLKNSYELAMKLVRDHDVAVAPGSAFGIAGEGCLRLCFAKHPDQLERSIRRLRDGLVSLGS
jgi:aspartate/methionine/tyrosine aminotransferase